MFGCPRNRGNFTRRFAPITPPTPNSLFLWTSLTSVGSALARETKTIPIVFVTVPDPIGSGLAASLNHPGGNITGFTFVESTMGGNRVELLKEIAPGTTHTALLFNPTTAPPIKFYMPSISSCRIILCCSDECRRGSG
jgi:ABC transporter substrate binding protein